MHRPNDQVRTNSSRPARCLRHHVWMAACDDCRAARGSLVAGRREGTPTAR